MEVGQGARRDGGGEGAARVAGKAFPEEAA